MGRQLPRHIPNAGNVGIAVLSAEAKSSGEVRADLVTVQQLEPVSPLEQASLQGPRQGGLPRTGEPSEPDHEASLCRLRRCRPGPAGRQATDPAVAVPTLIGASQHLRDLWAHEVTGDRLTGAEHAPHLGARERDALAVGMGTGLGGGHAAAGHAMEDLVEQERRDAQLLRRQRGDQPLSVERTVVGADAGLVSPDDKVGAAVILAHERVQESLPWAGVPHGRDEGRQQHAVGREVPQRRLVGLHAHLDGHVAILGRPDQRVEQQAVADLQCDPLQVLMGPVEWVAGLEADDPAPASGLERRPCLRGGQRVPASQASQWLDDGPDRTGNRQGRRGEDPGGARMGGIARPEHPLRLAQPIALVHLVDLEHAERVTARIAEGEPVAANPHPVGHTQAHRDGPQQPVW